MGSGLDLQYCGESGFVTVSESIAVPKRDRWQLLTEDPQLIYDAFLLSGIILLPFAGHPGIIHMGQHQISHCMWYPGSS